MHREINLLTTEGTNVDKGASWATGLRMTQQARQQRIVVARSERFVGKQNDQER